jgi:cellulose synthase/poly-beta-1,6-N-acetylglucosamine synthase-like glycosyltransferase
MEILTIILFVFLFLAIYFSCFFILLAIHNHKKIFYSPEAKKRYSISFLIAAWNEEKTIKNTIESLFSSNYPIKEIIVINDGSVDKTKEVVEELQKKYPRLKLINKEKNSGKADSLNIGIEKAKGELIAITDADSYPSPDAVEKMIGFFNDEKVACVTSCVFLKEKNKFFEKIQEIEYVFLAWTRKLLDFLDSVYVTTGPLSIYRKKVLLDVGGFDPNSITEDIELTWHMLSKGHKTRMSFDSRVYTTVPNKFKNWWRQRVRWGVGGIETVIKYRKFILKKGMFGCFIIPFVSLIIILSILGFIFGAYILFKNIFSGLSYTGYSISLRSSIFRMENLNTSPTILLILVSLLFILSFFYATYVFKKTGQKHIVKLSTIFNRLFYMLVYLTLTPAVWFDAIYRVIRKKEHKW